MKSTLTQPLLTLKQPLKRFLKPYYQWCKDTLEELRFLFQSKAPIFVYLSYFSSKLKKSSLQEQFQKPLEQFLQHKSSLTLTQDWFTRNIPFWLAVFDRYQFLRKSEIRALEIGSWEGLSSTFILKSLPNATLTCVDTWQGADEHKSGHAVSLAVLENIESRFDRNLQPYQNRLKKYKGTSLSYFNSAEKANFDFIYVDGSHYTDDVMCDAIKSFESLKVGGIMIFDDYFWHYYPRPMDNPAGAINAFLRLKRGYYKLLQVNEQVILEKTDYGFSTKT